jgi:hypothetical protein
MTELTNLEMIEKAKSVLKPRKLYLGDAGDVASPCLVPTANIKTRVIPLLRRVVNCSRKNLHENY